MCYLAILLLCLVWQPSSQHGINLPKISVYLALSFAATLVHIITNHEKNWMRIDTVFLLGFLIVNLQWPSMILFSNIFPVSTIMLRSVEGYVTYGTWLATLALASWAIGYAIPCKKRSRNVGVVTNLRVAGIIQVFVMVTFILLAGPDYLLGGQYAEIRYDVWATISGPAAYVFSIMTVTGVTLILASLYNEIQKGRKGGRVLRIQYLLSLPVVLTAAYIIMFLVAGERGQVVQIILAIGIVVGSTIRPVGFPLFALFIVGGSVVVSLLGIVRAYGIGNLAMYFNEFTAWNATENLANSAITLYLGFEIIENNDGFFWGKLWITNILSVVPFAQSFFIKLSGIPMYELNSAYLITYHVFGPTPHTGYGTSLIADIYMNFGVLGVIALMFAYGHVSNTCQYFIGAWSGFYPFLAAGMFASLVFYIARSSFFVQLQPVVWSYLFAIFVLKVRTLWRERGVRYRSQNGIGHQV